MAITDDIDLVPTNWEEAMVLLQASLELMPIEAKAMIIDFMANDMSPENLARLLGNALGVIGVDELVHNLKEYADSHYAEN